MPVAGTIFNWLLDEEKKEFLDQYKKAMDSRSDLMFDELIEIADEKGKDVMRARLRVDTRKWVLSRMKPKKYGDKLDVTSGGEKLPTPIMADYHKDVPTDNSVQKDNGAEEEG